MEDRIIAVIIMSARIKERTPRYTNRYGHVGTLFSCAIIKEVDFKFYISKQLNIYFSNDFCLVTNIVNRLYKLNDEVYFIYFELFPSVPLHEFTYPLQCYSVGAMATDPIFLEQISYNL